MEDVSNDEYREIIRRETAVEDDREYFPRHEINGCSLAIGMVVTVLCSAVLVLLIFFLLDMRSPNKVRLEGPCDCPPGLPGPAGPPGITGAVGQRGPKGDKGDPGPPGEDGVEGPRGDPGFCLGNPADPCPPGATGPQGPAGPQGATGIQGLPGPQGLTGPQGPRGYNGTQGEVGPAGPAGPMGPMGPNGTCDTTGNKTFTDQITFADEVFLNGGMTCATPLGPDCVSPLTCPVFTACDLVDNSMRHVAGMQVGQSGDPLGFGSSSYAYFGRRIPAAPPGVEWSLLEFNVYALNTDISALQLLSLYGQTVTLASNSGSVTVTSASSMTMTATGNLNMFTTTGDLSITSGSPTKRIVMSSAGEALINAVSINMTAPYVQAVRTGGNYWFRSRLADTLLCFDASSSSSGDAFEVDDDLIIANDNAIIAESGTLHVGPVLEVCSGQIVAAGNELTLGSNVNSSVAFWGPLLPSSNETCLVFGPAACFTFDGPISSPSGPVIVDDSLTVTGNVGVTGNAVVAGTLDVDRIDPESDTKVTITSLATNQIQLDTALRISVISPIEVTNTLYAEVITHHDGISPLQVTGDLVVTGNVNCAGGACASDMRYKTNVTAVDPAEAAARVRSLQVIDYQFTRETETSRSIEAGTRFRGFSAQATEKVVAQAVRKVSVPIGGHQVDDFRVLSKQDLVPDLWATVQYLLDRVEVLERSNQELRDKLK